MSLQSKFGHPARKHAEDTLTRLTAFLADDLAAVDELIHKALESQIGLTSEIGRYLETTSGKRLRPMLTVLASQVGGQGSEKAHYAAAMVELLHVASLLHDDVIDRAPTRRGHPTVNSRWGNEVAILMADYIYAHAWAVALEWLSADLLAILCRVAAGMCDGEMFQIEKRDQLLSEQDYLFIIRCKTAGLFSASLQLGAALGGAEENAVRALERYGLEFGCAFQITDDVLDFVADPRVLGKEIGTDIACGKQTLPLIHALGKAEADDRTLLVAALNNGSPSPSAVDRVTRYGGIEYAMVVARRHAQQARACLSELPDGPVCGFLRDLTELVVNRAH